MERALCFTLLIAACAVVRLEAGNHYLHPRIFGGHEVKPNQYPYQVGMYVTDPPQQKGGQELHSFCGGSLISEEYVLTAAHCVLGSLKADIILGGHNVKQPEEQGRIMVSVSKENFILHPAYDPEVSKNDIALIKLPGKVQLTDKIQIINLPKPSQLQSTLEGRLATITGWGMVSDTSEMSPVLLSTQMKVLRDRACQFYYKDKFDPTVQICVEAKLKSPCSGDSGGPLVLEDKDGSKMQIGIVSFTRLEGCEAGFPVIFTRLTSYLDWISKETGIAIRK